MATFVQPLAVSLAVWNKLSPAHQAAVIEAARIARDEQYTYGVKYDEDFMKFMLEKGGLKLVDGDIEAWVKAVQPMYDQLPQFARYYDKIKAYQADF